MELTDFDTASDTITPEAPSRRAFLQGTTAVAFSLAFWAPAKGEGGKGEKSAPPTPTAFNSFIAINDDNTVTAIVAQTEGGQGNLTGITQIIAAELGADWPLMRYQFNSERRPEYVNPALYKGLVLTAGSTSISAFYERFRTAAATTREMLTSAAAKQWSVPPAECFAEKSFILHKASGKKASFGSLAAAAAKEPIPEKPALRALDQLTLIGKPLPRLDTELKATGKARYGIDAQVPGMLYAAVRHGPAWGAKVASFDDSKAKKRKGVHLVMAVPQGIAVVADTYWGALKALEDVTEVYETHANASASTASVDAALTKSLGEPGAASPFSHGDAAKGLASAANVLEGTFDLPFVNHACMEPVSCTAHVQGDKIELWLSTQSVSLDAGFAASALGVDPSNVVIHNEFQGGSFGRRTGIEHTSEAVLLSKATDRPVKVVWTRKEDLHIDQHRTAVKTKARLGLDAQGMPVALEGKVAADGVWRSMLPWWYEALKPLDLPMFGLAGGPYGIPDEAALYVLTPMPVRIGPVRGNAELHNGYVLESLIDEAADVAKMDPLAYRRKLMAKDERNVAVLDRVAKLSNWGKAPKGRYQGVAFYQSKDFYKCRVATVVEVSKNKAGAIKVEKVWVVADSGLTINPNLAKQCLEGGTVFGLSQAMYEKTTLAGGAPEQQNFDTYRLMRMSECPDIVAEVIVVGDTPGSYGEISTMTAAPALANAIAKATGKRLRSQPFVDNVAFA